jgi:two-component system nitrate/nitrite response regulator NarL
MSNKPWKIRIIIADRREMFREGLRILLEEQPGFQVVADLASGAKLPAVAVEHKPDVILIHNRLRDQPGVEALREIAGLKLECRPVILTEAIDGTELIQALIWGACGLVHMNDEKELLYKCIHAVVSGDYWFGHNVITNLVKNIRALSDLVEKKTRQQSQSLTPRQRIIIEAIVSGSSNRDIAVQMSISERTVKYHLTRIFTRFGVSNRTELAQYALKNKVIPGI